MGKRITLSDFEIEQIVKALEAHQNATTLDYEVIAVGKRWYSALIYKLTNKDNEDK